MTTPRRPRFWLPILPLLLVLAACGDEPEPEAVAVEGPEAAEEAPLGAEVPTRLNINIASEEEMLTIPNMNDRMVHEFEEYRPYTSIEQFRREIGKYVDEEQVAAYEQYIFVPVRPNESDAETLQQLPGIDADEAEALIAARPYASQTAFLEALAAYASDDELAGAETYLED